MIPIRDYIPTRRPPLVNSVLIAANIVVYLLAFGLVFSPSEQSFAALLPYMVKPQQIMQGHGLGTLITAMFLHANLLHLAGNMLFLYIFGNNVEDNLGHVRYLLFYLGCGIVGGLLQSLVASGSTVPSLGASGAIAGVLAAYVVLYPRSPIGTIVIFGIIPLFFRLPALLVIGLWILIQFFSGYAELGVPAALQQGGVGYFAHIGGFLAGLVYIVTFRPKAVAWR